MKKIFFLLTIILLTLNIYCQNQTWQWAKKAVDGNGGGNEGYKIKIGASGNVYLMGNFDDDSIQFGSITIHNPSWGGNNNVYLLKCNASGNFIWGKCIGIGALTGYGFDIDDYENCYITGTFGGSLTIGSTTLIDNFVNGDNMFLAKFDSNGNPIWAKANSSVGDFGKVYIKVDAFGNVCILGEYFGDSVSFGGTTIHTTFYSMYNNDVDLYVTKFDSAGNPIWMRTGFGPNNYAHDVTTDAFGNVFITGSFGGYALHFDTITIFENNGGSWTDIYIAKYDSSGNIEWAKSEGGSNYPSDQGLCITTDALGNSYVGGLYIPNSTFDTIILNTFGGFLIAFSPTGNLIWLKTIVSRTAMVYGVVIDTSGNKYVTGAFQGDTITFDSITLTNNYNNTGSDGVFLAKYDHNGTIIWAKQGIGNGQGAGICSDNSGDIYITGDINDTMTFGSFVLPNFGYTSFIAKLGITTGEEQYKKTNGIVSVYPNPVSSILTIRTELDPTGGGYELGITDVLGREVYHSQFSSLNSQLFTIDVSGFSNGVYFYQLTNNKETYRGKFVVEK